MSGGAAPTRYSIPHESSDLANPLPPPDLRRSFLSFRHINSLVAAIVLAATGTVPFSDIAFFILSTLYIHFLSCSVFPVPPRSHPDPPVFSSTRLLPAYVSVGALLGLLLPAAYILHGVLEGDKAGIRAAAPHLFLLASQVFMEGVVFSTRFSLPMRAFVPVSYNARRLFAIADWLRSEFGKEEEVSGFRAVAGRALVITNMMFWAFNLFGFLLPVYLPRALKRYYANGADLTVK